MQSEIAALEAALEAGTVPAQSVDFARDLVRKADRGLSDKQLYWVRKLATPKPAAQQLTSTTAMTALVELFERVARRLKFPALLIGSEKVALRLSLAGEKSREPGTINVCTIGNYATREYVGRIRKDGSYQPAARFTAVDGDYAVEALRAFCIDPVKAAQDYAKLTGHCCFCGLLLRDKRSTNVGYGPICAQNWEMPWGAQ